LIKSEIIYIDSNNDFGNVVAQKIVDIILEILSINDNCCIALSGGTTPKPIFKELNKENYQNIITWDRVHIFFIDERCVPADHKDNNFKSCYNLWLQYYPEIHYHRIEGWIEPKEAAEKYEAEIISVLDKKDGIPQFDLIFMGMGEDGHVASLFPQYDFSKAKNLFVEDVYIKSKDMYRITMTFPMLNNAKNRIIGIVGEKKYKVFSDLMNSDYKDYPIAQLLSSNAFDTWVIN